MKKKPQSRPEVLIPFGHLSEETSVEICKAILMTFADLLGSHIGQIMHLAKSAESLKASVAVGLLLDMGGKNPKGNVKIEFAARVKDDANFQLEDKQQGKLL